MNQEPEPLDQAERSRRWRGGLSSKVDRLVTETHALRADLAGLREVIEAPPVLGFGCLRSPLGEITVILSGPLALPVVTLADGRTIAMTPARIHDSGFTQHVVAAPPDRANAWWGSLPVDPALTEMPVTIEADGRTVHATARWPEPASSPPLSRRRRKTAKREFYTMPVNEYVRTLEARLALARVRRGQLTQALGRPWGFSASADEQVRGAEAAGRQLKLIEREIAEVCHLLGRSTPIAGSVSLKVPPSAKPAANRHVAVKRAVPQYMTKMLVAGR